MQPVATSPFQLYNSAQPDHQSCIPWTLMVQGENFLLLEVVLWLPHLGCNMHVPTQVLHTFSFQKDCICMDVLPALCPHRVQALLVAAGRRRVFWNWNFVYPRHR